MKIADAIAERMRVHGAYVRCFDTPDGRAVLKHLAKIGFISNSTFVAGDTHLTALQEGSRRLVLSILKEINRDTKELVDQIQKSYDD